MDQHLAFSLKPAASGFRGEFGHIKQEVGAGVGGDVGGGHVHRVPASRGQAELASLQNRELCRLSQEHFEARLQGEQGAHAHPVEVGRRKD